jgi:hypothetical protein
MRKWESGLGGNLAEVARKSLWGALWLAILAWRPHSPPDMIRTPLLLSCAALGLLLNACQTVDSHMDGGGAYDDSPLARALDSNNPDLGDDKDAARAETFEQWREQE